MIKNFILALFFSSLSFVQAQDCGSFKLFNFTDTVVSYWNWPDTVPGFYFDMTYDSLWAANTGYISFFFVDQNLDTITIKDYYLWSRYFHWNPGDTERYIMALDSGYTKFPDNFNGHLVTINPECQIPYSNTLSISSHPSIDVRIYPNPTQDYLEIISEFIPIKISLYDTRGELIRETLDYPKVDISDLPSAIYLMQIDFLGKQSVHQRFIKE